MPPPSSEQQFLASLTELICPICEDAFGEAHFPISIDGCRHVFGSECIKKWVRSTNAGRNKCPTCRRVMFETGSRTADVAIVELEQTGTYLLVHSLTCEHLQKLQQEVRQQEQRQ